MTNPKPSPLSRTDRGAAGRVRGYLVIEKKEHLLRFAASLTNLYTEYPFLERFAAAAQDGFKATEFLFPYDYEAAKISSLLESHGLQQVLINAPAGDWAAGERGLACLPDREDHFRASIHRALEYADALACPQVHVMAGIAPWTQNEQGCAKFISSGLPGQLSGPLPQARIY